MQLDELKQMKEKVIELCGINDIKDEEILTDCFNIIDKYLSCDGSSTEYLLYLLDFAIKNQAWLYFWQTIKKETDKLLNCEIDNSKEDEMLISYNPINLGERFLTNDELNKINIDLGVIDKFGVYHTSKREGVMPFKYPDHRKLANYLNLQNKITDYYMRVGCICGENDEIICAESLFYGNEYLLKHFLFTEEMSIALYNAVMSKKDYRFTTFEEKLSYYGTEFGYYSIKYDVFPRIYDKELFNNNMKVLSYTLGKRFDRKYFSDILTR